MANEFAQTIWQWIRNRQICGKKFRKGFLVARIPGYDVLREPKRVMARIEECVREQMRELGAD